MKEFFLVLWNLLYVILNELESKLEQGLCIPFAHGSFRTEHKLNPF